jgi:hypothetical protein
MHCTFSTKDRYPFIDSNLESRLWPCLGRIARENRMRGLAIGGTTDHVTPVTWVRKKTIQRVVSSRSSRLLVATSHANLGIALNANSQSLFPVSRSPMMLRAASATTDPQVVSQCPCALTAELRPQSFPPAWQQALNHRQVLADSRKRENAQPRCGHHECACSSASDHRRQGLFLRQLRLRWLVLPRCADAPGDP